MTGMLTNNGSATFNVQGAGDMVSIGNGLSNAGVLNVEQCCGLPEMSTTPEVWSAVES